MAQAKHARAKHARTAKTSSPRRTGAAGADASKAVRGGIAQLVTPSPELGAIVGMAPLSRAEVTTRVWAYIKAHELQDAQDRRQIPLRRPGALRRGRGVVLCRHRCCTAPHSYCPVAPAALATAPDGSQGLARSSPLATDDAERIRGAADVPHAASQTTAAPGTRRIAR